MVCIPATVELFLVWKETWESGEDEGGTCIFTPDKNIVKSVFSLKESLIQKIITFRCPKYANNTVEHMN